MLLEEAVPTYHVSGTPSYLEQDVARWQDRLAYCLKKLFPRITYQERLASYLKKMLQCVTYQECLASYLTKMLQRIRNVFQVT